MESCTRTLERCSDEVVSENHFGSEYHYSTGTLFDLGYRNNSGRKSTSPTGGWINVGLVSLILTLQLALVP